jgi:hypothetical protein
MEDRYFSACILDQDPFSDAFKRNLYTTFLEAMDEPPLAGLGVESVEVYRFLWLRTFHHPIAVRLQRREADGTLTAKELDGTGANEPGTLSGKVVEPVTLDRWSSFLALLEEAGYWEMAPSELGLAVDGALWLLEGYRDGTYRVVDRYSPRVAGPDATFRRACRLLLGLAGMEVSAAEVY